MKAIEDERSAASNNENPDTPKSDQEEDLKPDELKDDEDDLSDDDN